jgi:alginate production protein
VWSTGPRGRIRGTAGSTVRSAPSVPNLGPSSCYHYYHQAVPAPFLRDTKLKADPNGKSGAIGHEWDLVLGLEEWEHLEVELVGTVFRAESAFGQLSANFAEGLFVKLKWNF